MYGVFAAFGDPRLPPVYAGDDSAPDDLVMQAAAEAWPTLLAAQQAELRPFFTPPAVSGSWFSARGSAARGAVAAGASKGLMCLQAPPSTAGWYTFAAPGGHVRLWWSKTDNARIGPQMRRLASEIENTIWPRLHTLMGREPLSDAGVSCFHGIDDKLDIYMLRGKLDAYTKDPAIGLTVPYTGCKARPTYIVLDTRSGVPRRWVLAHELMHAFQLAFDFRDGCNSYHDWNETTATWAEQYVYPRDNERPYFYAVVPRRLADQGLLRRLAIPVRDRATARRPNDRHHLPADRAAARRAGDRRRPPGRARASVARVRAQGLERRPGRSELQAMGPVQRTTARGTPARSDRDPRRDPGLAARTRVARPGVAHACVPPLRGRRERHPGLDHPAARFWDPRRRDRALRRRQHPDRANPGIAGFLLGRLYPGEAPVRSRARRIEQRADGPHVRRSAQAVRH